MSHDCHFEKEGKKPTHDDCRACHLYTDSSVYSDDVSIKYWERLASYMQSETKLGIEKLMQSDQMAHLYHSLSTRSHMMSQQMMMLAEVFGVKIDLVPTIHTAFALGYVLANTPPLEPLTWVMLNDLMEKEGTIGEVEKFLKGLNDGNLEEGT